MLMFSEKVLMAGLTAKGYEIQPTKKKRSTKVDASLGRMEATFDRLVSHVISHDQDNNTPPRSETELLQVKQAVSKIDTRLNQLSSSLDKIVESQTLLAEQLRKMQAGPTLFQNASLFQ
jgi:hypothetical protein